MQVQSAIYMRQTYGNRAREVLRRMYIWHKQKAMAPKASRDDIARHNGYMSLIAIEQKVLANS